jgi:hypothetical protein
MALGSGAGGGGLNRVIRRASRRGAPTATGAGVPNTATPVTSAPSSSVGYVPPAATVAPSQAVSRPRLPAIPTSLLAQLNPSLAGALSAGKPKPRVLQKAMNDALESISDPAARRLAPLAVQASRSVKGAVPASVLLALSGQESDFGRNQGPSSAGAQGVTQFIPSTRQSFIDQYGVDPWKNAKSGFKASALYLRDLGFKSDPQGALSSYSGGYAAGDYNNPILQSAQQFQPLDRLVGRKGRIPTGGGGGRGSRNLDVAELYYDPGINLRDNQPTSPVGDHDTHVHFASESPRDVLRAAVIAQRQGATVGENPAFGSGSVAPVHAGTDAVAPAAQAQDRSYHYRAMRIPRGLRQSKLADRAGISGKTITQGIDISGGDLGAINQRIASLAGGSSRGGYGGGGLSGLSGGLTSGTSSGSSYTPTASSGAQLPAMAGSQLAAVSSRQQATSLQDLLGSLSPPSRSGLSREGLTPAKPMPRTRLTSRRGDEEEEDEERTLYELLYGSS